MNKTAQGVKPVTHFALPAARVNSALIQELVAFGFPAGCQSAQISRFCGLWIRRLGSTLSERGSGDPHYRRSGDRRYKGRRLRVLRWGTGFLVDRGAGFFGRARMCGPGDQQYRRLGGRRRFASSGAEARVHGGFGSIHRVHRGLFVDLGPIFQYSKVLARCCAWGLGVLTRTDLREALEGFGGLRGTGHRLRDPENVVRRSQGPRGANSRSFSPEQICLAVGRF